MRILWFTWKDRKNPFAGGAEVVNEELAKRLARDGHEIVFLVRGHQGLPAKETIDGYKIIRVGSYRSVYREAFGYYRKNLVGWADLVIDEVNTIPFFCKFFVRERNVMLFHQLCRRIWFYELSFWKGLVGYLMEPVYLWFLNDRDVITVSRSTKENLLWNGFHRERINIISEGTELAPLENLDIPKFERPTLLSLGSMRPMKRTDQILKAFELAKKKIPELELVLAGAAEGSFGQKVLDLVEQSEYKSSIRYLGKVKKEEKMELMRKAHLIASASVKEGWGLIVTEANSQGTPAVVYDVDGLRDSVKNGRTGWIVNKNTPQGLAEKIAEAFSDKTQYENIRQAAWQWSKEINFEKSYADFAGLLRAYLETERISIVQKIFSFCSSFFKSERLMASKKYGDSQN